MLAGENFHYAFSEYGAMVTKKLRAAFPWKTQAEFNSLILQNATSNKG